MIKDSAVPLRGEVVRLSQPLVGWKSVVRLRRYLGIWYSASKAATKKSGPWRRPQPRYCLARLEIPSGALVVWPHHESKLRCDRALVKGILSEGYSLHSRARSYRQSHGPVDAKELEFLTYRAGQEVAPYESLDQELDTACASGIHFFLDSGEARQFALLLGLVP